jgi:hypothetical protein
LSRSPSGGTNVRGVVETDTGSAGRNDADGAEGSVADGLSRDDRARSSRRNRQSSSLGAGVMLCDCGWADLNSAPHAIERITPRVTREQQLIIRSSGCRPAVDTYDQMKSYRCVSRYNDIRLYRAASIPDVPAERCVARFSATLTLQPDVNSPGGTSFRWPGCRGDQCLVLSRPLRSRFEGWLDGEHLEC